MLGSAYIGRSRERIDRLEAELAITSEGADDFFLII
jgi:hypothetical protein